MGNMSIKGVGPFVTDDNDPKKPGKRKGKNDLYIDTASIRIGQHNQIQTLHILLLHTFAPITRYFCEYFEDYAALHPGSFFAQSKDCGSD
jgi:hypothetical protein